MQNEAFLYKGRIFITNWFTTERKEMKNNNASGIQHTHRIYKQDEFSNSRTPQTHQLKHTIKYNFHIARERKPCYCRVDLENKEKKEASKQATVKGKDE